MKSNRHVIWLRFCSDNQAELDANELMPVALSENKFRDLLHSGSISVHGASVTLESLTPQQWAALSDFCERYFNEFESYSPLEQFLAYAKEHERRCDT